MHSLHHENHFTTGAASALPALTAPQRDHLRGKLLPRDLLAEDAPPAVRDRAHGLRRWMRSQAGLLREKLSAAAQSVKAPEWRAELRTLEQVRERLIAVELAPAGWVLYDKAQPDLTEGNHCRLRGTGELVIYEGLCSSGRCIVRTVAKGERLSIRGCDLVAAEEPQPGRDMCHGMEVRA